MPDASDALRDQLIECVRTSELVGIHRWADDPTLLLVVIVEKVNPRSIRVRPVDSLGSLGESTAVPSDQIVQVDRNTPYLLRLQLWLSEFGGQQPTRVTRPRVIRNPVEIVEALTPTSDEGIVVDIKLRKDQYATYIVHSCGEGWVLVSQLDDLCRPLGRSLLRTDVIAAVRLNPTNERETWLYRRHSSTED